MDSAKLAWSWTLGSYVVEAGSCTSIEYGITPGTHRVLRFTVGTPNIGDADAVVGDPLAHVDPSQSILSPDSTDACSVRDEQNFCRVLRESNHSDNVATLRITLA